ncbi:hypothetical protein U879_21005 [Defluviimonas sp. 20V17]|uniref:ATP-grasp domain-containing protein n=1 Tax=Allgaiera indica TaxID=765699 RepID=A0AAN4UTI0_9RHOB|nr:acetate--CoA ligase family protein [Allgaiera indica]KDB01683.1 hypothetical protein U879_21005 [Defluviimonas sp. 20V17]GHE04029.1 hypothetical protein GCM10008024_29590 [Allgaiera indica]SDX33937.1 ATP-grasp domain-containing protein [Allgaiera indica]
MIRRDDLSGYDFAALGALLSPGSVAIVGASADPSRIGGRPIAAMLQAAHARILASVAANVARARVGGALVAGQLSGGTECLMGVSRDPVFGPVVVFVDILKDVAIRPCPVPKAEACEMILWIGGAQILRGARGRPPADLDALVAMLSRLSVFALAAGARLGAIDLNPVLALPDGACTPDAVIDIAPKVTA